MYTRFMLILGLVALLAATRVTLIPVVQSRLSGDSMDYELKPGDMVGHCVQKTEPGSRSLQDMLTGFPRPI